ncbi:GNAT family N-acetyltransferase, partial [Streptomyces sp. NPDC059627]
VAAPCPQSEGHPHSLDNTVHLREGILRLVIGSALLGPLIAAAREAGHHVMIAGIEAGNAASIRLHDRFGFEDVGTVREVGIKFGRWLDLTIMRLALTWDGDAGGVTTD